MSQPPSRPQNTQPSYPLQPPTMNARPIQPGVSQSRPERPSQGDFATGGIQRPSYPSMGSSFNSVPSQGVMNNASTGSGPGIGALGDSRPIRAFNAAGFRPSTPNLPKPTLGGAPNASTSQTQFQGGLRGGEGLQPGSNSQQFALKSPNMPVGRPGSGGSQPLVSSGYQNQGGRPQFMALQGTNGPQAGLNAGVSQIQQPMSSMSISNQRPPPRVNGSFSAGGAGFGTPSVNQQSTPNVNSGPMVNQNIHAPAATSQFPAPSIGQTPPVSGGKYPAQSFGQPVGQLRPPTSSQPPITSPRPMNSFPPSNQFPPPMSGQPVNQQSPVGGVQSPNQFQNGALQSPNQFKSGLQPASQFQSGVQSGQFQNGGVTAPQFQNGPSNQFQNGVPQPGSQFQNGGGPPANQFQNGVPQPTGQFQNGVPQPPNQYQAGGVQPPNSYLPVNNQYPPGQGQYPPNAQQPIPNPNYQQGRPSYSQPGFPQPNQYNQPYPANPGMQQPQAEKQRIDPDQIPSTVVEREKDQKTYAEVAFTTSSRIAPPFSTTNFRAIDEGSCNPRFIRSTMYNIPTTDAILKTSAIPFGIVVQPLADLNPDESPIPVVDFGKAGPVRCTRCLAYVNPNFQFLNGGRLFVCNLCGMNNEVPPEYVCNLDMNGRRMDILQRPELLYGTYEFAVQDQYCARPPRPASYLFALDVSWNAVQSGMVSIFCSSLKNYLYSRENALPKGARVGIITFDKALHFYNLDSKLENFKMLIVSDIQDVFSPIETGLLVDYIESKALIESLLDTLPNLFAEGRVVESAIGSAAQSSFEALKNFGGKLSIFCSGLPQYGLGVLKPREDPKLMGTDKERQLYEPQDVFWPKLGKECAVNGVNVDLYIFPKGYMDLATVGTISSLSGGDLYLYQEFEAAKTGVKFANDLQRALARTFGFDALLRIRTSKGLLIDDYLGNFYMKNGTDIELAGLDCLKSFVAVLKLDGNLDEKQDSFVQAALLYTTGDGNRRVRVHNLSLASTSQLGMVFRQASLETTCSVLARQMVQRAMSSTLTAVHDFLTGACVKILVSYRVNVAAPTASGQLILPEAFKLFPIYALGLLKTRAFMTGSISSTDLRIYSMRLLNSLGVGELATYLYPNLYDCSDLLDGIGQVGPEGIIMYPGVRSSKMRLQSDRIYLIENGRHMFLFIGSSVPPRTLLDLFGVDSLGAISPLGELPQIDVPHNIQLRGAIQYVRSTKQRFMHLNICRQGIDALSERRFYGLMVEDASLHGQSYPDYLVTIHRAIQSQIPSRS